MLDLSELFGLTPEGGEIVSLVIKATRKDSPGGKKITKAERKRITAKVTKLVAKGALEAAD
jgi:hypothetical protein